MPESLPELGGDLFLGLGRSMMALAIWPPAMRCQWAETTADATGEIGAFDSELRWHAPDGNGLARAHSCHTPADELGLRLITAPRREVACWMFIHLPNTLLTEIWGLVTHVGEAFSQKRRPTLQPTAASAGRADGSAYSGQGVCIYVPAKVPSFSIFVHGIPKQYQYCTGITTQRA